MIIKQYQIKNTNLNKYNLYLLYGKNEGLQNEVISEKFLKNFKGGLNRYDENEFINNNETLISEFYNKSLFDDEKIIIISRSTDKIVKFIETILKKSVDNVKIILKSGALEKRSKLRTLFEKNNTIITIPFYEDDQENLTPIVYNFMNKNNINLSRESINLIVSRAGGDRENLKQELDKIYNYAITNKNVGLETIQRLSNLVENFSVNELADSYLEKNKKNVAKILNENNYSDEDCILILRTILNKSKRLLNVIEKYNKDENLDEVISSVRPPIFWKDKGIVKKQAKSWDLVDLKNKIFKINKIEALVKTNSKNALNLVSDFVINYQ